MTSVYKKTILPLILLCGISVTTLVGWFLNTLLLSGITLNHMLMGVSFTTVFFNMITTEQFDKVNRYFAPILGIALLTTIVVLGTPLDYHLILGAGLYTFIYIAAAAIINEFIAVIATKKGFELAGEIQKS